MTEGSDPPTHIAYWLDKISTHVGFGPLTACTAAKIALKFFAAVFDFVAGNKGKAVKELVSMFADALGFVDGGAASCEVSHFLYKDIGVMTSKLIKATKEAKAWLKWIPNAQGKVLSAAINGIASGLSDLASLLTPDDAYANNAYVPTDKEMRGL